MDSIPLCVHSAQVRKVSINHVVCL
jgi:hypothetical protein